MNSLRFKLAFSYGTLILLILFVSIWNIFHFIRLGRAVDTILINNYQSIVASENMKEALERQDSSALFYIAGYQQKAREQFYHNSKRFSDEFNIVAHNITELGEDNIVKDIDQQYKRYQLSLNNFIVARSNQSNDLANNYFTNLEPAFLSIKNRLDDLLHLNQAAMVRANDQALQLAWRAEVYTIIFAIVALSIALIFSWRFIKFVADPIVSLKEKARLIGEGDLDQSIKINSNDEIGLLAMEFNRMTAKLREIERSQSWHLLMERKKSDAVIEAIGEPVIVTDAKGQITKLNSSARKLFHDIPEDEGEDDIDRSLSQIGAGSSIIKAVRDTILMQKPIGNVDDNAIVPVKVSGIDRSYRLRATPVRDSDGRLLGSVSLLEDITTMQEIDRLKTEFISIASKKMRTPLQSLRTALYTLMYGYAGEFTEKQFDILYAARDEGEKLDELMIDLLELTEIESGAKKLQIDVHRPIELIRSTIDQHKADADSKDISFINDVSPDLSPILADQQAIKRIFDNLISNAIRHTERNGTITFSAVERTGFIYFSIADSGEGIPEEILPNLFARFIKLNDSSAGGTGLGLALVKKLVEAQMGTVAVQSKVGEGTTITFSLPLAQKEPINLYTIV